MRGACWPPSKLAVMGRLHSGIAFRTSVLSYGLTEVLQAKAEPDVASSSDKRVHQVKLDIKMQRAEA